MASATKEVATTTRLFSVLRPQDPPPAEADSEWATGTPRTTTTSIVCDVDVKYKRPGSFVFRSHGFFHAMTLTEENVLSRLSPGDYELHFQRCDGHRPSPRTLRFHVVSSDASVSPPATTPLHVGTIKMHKVRFQFLRTVAPGLITLVVVILTVILAWQSCPLPRSVNNKKKKQEKQEEEVMATTTTTTTATSLSSSSSSRSRSRVASPLTSSASASVMGNPGDVKEEAAQRQPESVEDVQPLISLPKNEAQWQNLFEKVYSSPSSDEDDLAGFGLTPGAIQSGRSDASTGVRSSRSRPPSAFSAAASPILSPVDGMGEGDNEENAEGVGDQMGWFEDYWRLEGSGTRSPPE